MTAALDATTRLRVSKSVYARPFGEEIVVLDFARGEYFALDAVGADVWRALEKGSPLQTIAAAIANDYEVSEADALRDIIALSQELLDQKLVEREPRQ
jgi:hypothetical protein